MRSIIFAIVVLTTSSVLADIADVFHNVVRINCPDGVGTGSVFEETETTFHVLTAAHVIQKAKEPGVFYEDCHLNFYGSGKQSDLIPGKVRWANLIDDKKNVAVCRDVALIEVQKKDFGSFPHPAVIPLAKRNVKLKAEETILSTGCPSGNWPSCFLGHVVDVTSFDNMVLLRPNIIPGRSGSPVTDSKGKAVHGVIVWYNNRDNIASAISLQTIYEALDQHRLPVQVDPND